MPYHLPSPTPPISSPFSPPLGYPILPLPLPYYTLPFPTLPSHPLCSAPLPNLALPPLPSHSLPSAPLASPPLSSPTLLYPPNTYPLIPYHIYPLPCHIPLASRGRKSPSLPTLDYLIQPYTALNYPTLSYPLLTHSSPLPYLILISSPLLHYITLPSPTNFPTLSFHLLYSPFILQLTYPTLQSPIPLICPSLPTPRLTYLPYSTLPPLS